jgi:hypothetical protein
VSHIRRHSDGRDIEIDFETDNAILEFKASGGSGLQHQLIDRTDIGMNPSGKTLIGVAGHRGLSRHVKRGLESNGFLASDMNNVPTILDVIAPQ